MANWVQCTGDGGQLVHVKLDTVFAVWSEGKGLTIIKSIGGETLIVTESPEAIIAEPAESKP